MGDDADGRIEGEPHTDAEADALRQQEMPYLRCEGCADEGGAEVKLELMTDGENTEHLRLNRHTNRDGRSRSDSWDEPGHNGGDKKGCGPDVSKRLGADAGSV